MKVAMETTTATSQGLRLPAAERLAAACWPLIEILHPRHDRHAGPEKHVGRRVENNLDRHTLDDLDEVARCILRWQQAERRAAARLDRVDMTLENPARVGVDLDVHRGSRLHVVQFRFFEVRCNPDLAGHEHHQRLSDRCVFAVGGRKPRDPPGDGRGDHGPGQIDFGLFQGGFSLLQLSARLLSRGLQHRNLFLVGHRVGLSRSKSCLGLEKIGRVLLSLFDGDRPVLDQALVSLVLLLCKGQRRL